MYYYGARYYDPRISIFVSVDQMVEETMTPYQYVHNNPIMFTDPTGMSADPPEGEFAQGYRHTDEEGTTWQLNGRVWENQSGGEDQWQSETLDEVVIGANRKSEGVGQPGALESAIPIWGSGRAAVDHFQNGNYWRGAAYTALAVSDVFAIKAIGTAVVKGGIALSAKYAAKETATHYSVAYEMKLASSSYPGVYRGAHFLEANKALNATMASDAAFAKSMTALGINIPKSTTGSILGKSPANWVWHHAAEKGVMQLVPKAQHTIGSPFWSLMHQGGKGGFAIWGK